jgi:hypothetical protein
LERNFIELLENSSRVTWFLEQPISIQYMDDGEPAVYTPDFLVVLTTGEQLYVEVKNTPEMLCARVLKRLVALWQHCQQQGAGLLITNGRYSLQRFLSYQRDHAFEQRLLERLKRPSDTVFHGWLQECQEPTAARHQQLMAAILHHRLWFKTFPLIIRRPKQEPTYWQFVETYLSAPQPKTGK